MWEIFDILYSRLRSIERRPVWKTLGSNKAYITRHPNNLWSQERQGGKETRVGNVQNLLFPFLFFFAFLYRHQAVNKRRHPFDLTQTSSSDTHWEIFERPAKNSFYLTNAEQQKIVAKLQGQMSSLHIIKSFRYCFRNHQTFQIKKRTNFRSLTIVLFKHGYPSQDRRWL